MPQHVFLALATHVFLFWPRRSWQTPHDRPYIIDVALACFFTSGPHMYFRRGPRPTVSKLIVFCPACVSILGLTCACISSPGLTMRLWPEPCPLGTLNMYFRRGPGRQPPDPMSNHVFPLRPRLLFSSTAPHVFSALALLLLLACLLCLVFRIVARACISGRCPRMFFRFLPSPPAMCCSGEASI